ncbi:MAG: ATP-grasp domain-containing protein [Dehalococcoidia bacterium]|nr:ATP-grasp domain-containing protein [Dehalococcoidia bacterium]
MFKKLLIANRGEIACRVIRTARAMGIRTVAVYSDADAKALHVQQADEAHRLGPSSAAQSYLSIDRILGVARRAGADAIHPGYGFLSQNSAFAKACAEAGVTFVGPKPEVMQAMGDKVLARRLAQEAKLPLVPGVEREVSDEEAMDIAEVLGFPVMVKAAEGGGGIGIRVVRRPNSLQRVLARSRTLAEGAFGSRRMYLERFVEDASHVEVQVLADEHGNAVHLFERDCSVQRRNQKIVEETPCPKLDDGLRQALYDAALSLVRHIKYTNAGTVEFLVDRQHRFYFLEMNTRLQVEHGITEMVTGLDLVGLQLRVAAGERLPFRQEDIQRKGHAIEGRLYPEEPETFLPSLGTLRSFEAPQGEGVRLDSALFVGYEVTPFYEPMLGKLMAWGKDRQEAIERLENALREMRLSGLTVNVPVLRAVLGDPTFRVGSYDCNLLTRLTGKRRHHRSLAQLPPGAGSAEGDEHEDEDEAQRELAAAVGLALALSGRNPVAAKTPQWRQVGRLEQMRTRLGGRAPW